MFVNENLNSIAVYEMYIYKWWRVPAVICVVYCGGPVMGWMVSSVGVVFPLSEEFQTFCEVLCWHDSCLRMNLSLNFPEKGSGNV